MPVRPVASETRRVRYLVVMSKIAMHLALAAGGVVAP
jgi:hypothetical protein